MAGHSDWLEVMGVATASSIGVGGGNRFGVLANQQQGK